MFKYFPKINYFVDNYNFLVGIDIAERVKINDYLKSVDAVGARDYEIKEGELPENISFTVYGRPSYAYMILLLNNIQNFYDEWPMDSKTFKNFITFKYGSVANARSQNMFYYVNGLICDEDTYQASTDPEKYIETSYDYENRLNDEKRKIKLLNPSIVKKAEVAIQEILNSTSGA